jgi:hypothetical protein
MPYMSVSNAMWSSAVITVVYFRNRTFSRAVGPFGGVPLTLLTLVEPYASKFHVDSCIFFAKVHDKLRRKLGEKAFCGVMVGFPSDTPCYRMYNPVTRRITTCVLVILQETVPGFQPSPKTDSLILDDMDADNGSA